MKFWLRTAAFFLIAAVVLGGCALLSGKFDFDRFNVSEYEEAEYICAEPVTAVKVIDGDQDIEILPSTDGTCRIEYMYGEYDNYDISLEDGLLTVEMDEKFHFGLFGFDRTIRIYLPEGEYESLTVDSSSGDILVTGCSASIIALDAASGDISAINCSAANFGLSASSGEICVKDCDAVYNEISATSGDIDVQGMTAAEKLTVESASGDIEIKCSSASAVEVSAASGDVEADDITAAGQLVIDTASGDVSFMRADAGSIYVNAASGDVYGSVVKPMLYEAHAASGNVDIPVPMRDAGICRIETASGDITIIEE